MTKINWIPQLQPHEWPDGVIPQMAPSLFNDVIIPLRQHSGVAMTPSPLVEGHVRQEGKSRHSTKNSTRLSDASDLFIPSTRQAVANVLRVSQQLPAGGIGVYFDTTPSVMIHVDTRSQRLLWLRVDGEYIYELNDPLRFYSELVKQMKKLEK